MLHALLDTNALVMTDNSKQHYYTTLEAFYKAGKVTSVQMKLIMWDIFYMRFSKDVRLKFNLRFYGGSAVCTVHWN